MRPITRAGFGSIALIALASLPALAATTLTVQVTSTVGDNSYKMQRAWFDEYERLHPGVKIEMLDASAYGKLAAEIAAGVPPDATYVGANVPALAKQGILLNLDPYFKRDGIDPNQRYFPILVQADTYAGHLYASPNDAAPHILYENLDILAASGIDASVLADPTWEALEAVAKKATVKDASGHFKTYGFAPQFSARMVMQWVWQNGGDVLNADGAPNFDTPEVVGGIDYLHRLYNVDGVTTSPDQAPWNIFADGQAATLQQGAWMASTQLRDVDFKWDMMLPTKHVQRATGISFGNYAIPYNSKHKEEAWQLLKWLSSVEGQSFLMGHGFAAMPANREAAQSTAILKAAFGNPKAPNLSLSVIPASAAVGRYLPIVPPMDQASSIIEKGLADVWSGKSPAQSAVKQIQQQLMGIYQSGK